MRGRIRIAVAIFAVGTLARVPCADALNFFELEAYGAGTRGRGALHVESFNTVVAKGGETADDGIVATDDMVRTTVEVNYGVAERMDLALYVDMAKPDGRDFQHAGTRVRLRGPVEQRYLPFDLGWYAELEFPRSRFAEEDAALEVRPIMSRDWQRFSLRLNPILEQPFNGEEAEDGPELQYAARASYSASERVALALEAFGELGPISGIPSTTRQQHYLVPLLKVRPWRRIDVGVGPGFGLTRSSEDLFVKLVFKYSFDRPSK